MAITIAEWFRGTAAYALAKKPKGLPGLGERTCAHHQTPGDSDAGNKQPVAVHDFSSDRATLGLPAASCRRPWHGVQEECTAEPWEEWCYVLKCFCSKRNVSALANSGVAMLRTGRGGTEGGKRKPNCASSRFPMNDSGLERATGGRGRRVGGATPHFLNVFPQVPCRGTSRMCRVRQKCCGRSRWPANKGQQATAHRGA